MSDIPWGTLQTVQDWADVLEGLLEDARRAVEKGNPRSRLRAQKDLIEFTRRSPAMCAALDDIASVAASDLFLSQVDAALRELSARQKELSRARDAIDTTADRIHSDARELGFASLVTVLDRTTSALRTMKELESATNDPDRHLLEKIADALRAIEEIQRISQQR